MDGDITTVDEVLRAALKSPLQNQEVVSTHARGQSRGPVFAGGAPDSAKNKEQQQRESRKGRRSHRKSAHMNHGSKYGIVKIEGNIRMKPTSCSM